MYIPLVRDVVHRTGYPMSLSRKTRKAARKYGPRVDALARRRYGISGEALLDKLIQGESGDRKNAVSNKGARGKAQFMPGTRQAALRYGVDPWKGSDQAVHAAELHLKGRLTGSKGLEGYNPGGGRHYVDYILGQKIGNVTKGGRSRTGNVSGRGGSVRSNVRTDKSSRTRSTFDKKGYETALRGETLARLFSKHEGGSVLTRSGLLSGAPVNKDDFKGTKTTNSRKVSLLSTEMPGTKGSKGTVNFEGKQVAAWIAPILREARKKGWKGQVTSGHRSRAEQTRIYNSGVRPAAKPGTSNHEGTQFPRGAVDVSDAQTLSKILRNSKYRGQLQWAGAKDPVHFSHPHGGGY